MQAFKLFIFAVCIAAANAGLALTSTSDNTYRSHGNLAQISTQSKSIDTPYSSSSKTDIRVSNPAVYATAAPIGHYAAPAVQHYSSAPAIQHYSPAPAIQHYAAAPAVQHYAAAPAVQHYAAAPAVQHYAAAPAVQHYAAAPAVQHYAAAPAVQHYAAAPAVQHYSAAPAIQHYASAPVGHSGPVYTSAPGPVISKTAYAVSAPTVHYAQPSHQVGQAVYAHAAPVSYAQASPVSYAHAASAGYAHGGQISAHQPLLGVAYSPASTAAHLTYNNVNDHVNYAW